MFNIGDIVVLTETACMARNVSYENMPVFIISNVTFDELDNCVVYELDNDELNRHLAVNEYEVERYYG